MSILGHLVRLTAGGEAYCSHLYVCSDSTPHPVMNPAMKEGEGHGNEAHARTSTTSLAGI